MEKIVIRQATLADTEGLISLYIELYKQFTSHGFDPSVSSEASLSPTNKPGIVGLVASDEAEARRLLRMFLESEDATIFVAEREGKLVGFLEVAMKQDHPGLPSGLSRSGPGYPGSFWVSDLAYREA